jgi:SAM-dependent methyltransferase
MEPERVAEVLAEHPAVRRAAVLPEGGRWVAYVVPGAAGESGHLSQWRALWSDTYGRSTVEDPALNLAGWVSSYTGMPVPEREMREWIDRTVDRILALAPRRVLEIGCGMGLLLLRVAPACAQYLGVDFSAEALEHVRRAAAEKGLGQVELLERPADDLRGVPEGSFDLVVLNSVAQYFPGLGYLRRVLAGAAAAAAPGGRIFLGDLRSLPLLAAFHASVQLQQADAETPLAELRERVESRLAQEGELVIDPAFFAALRGSLPRLAGVDVELRRGRARNEMTRFRYDVTLYLDRPGPAGGEPGRWLDWGEAGAAPVTPAALRRLLAESAPPSLGVRGVPNARVAADARAAVLLRAPVDGGEGLATAGDLLAALRRERPPGIEPEDFWALGRDLPYRIEIRWSAGREDGAYDVVLRHRDHPDPPGEAAAPAAPPDSRPFTNSPLREQIEGRLAAELRRYLEERLPGGPIPESFVVVDELPGGAP